MIYLKRDSDQPVEFFSDPSRQAHWAEFLNIPIPFLWDKTSQEKFLAAFKARFDDKGLVIKQTDLDGSRADFSKHYFDRSPGIGNPSFYENFRIPWLDFRKKVEATIGAMAPERLVLKFIHRYAPGDCRWFLTVKMCEIDAAVVIDGSVLGQQVPIIQHDLYFDIARGGISNTDATQLVDAIGDRTQQYGKDYFGCVCDTSGPVAPGTHVHSASFAWIELAWLFDLNEIGARTDMAKFDIVFNPISFQADPFPSLNVNVEFPHSLALNMCYDSRDCLDDIDVIAAFYNSAADFNTLCPPHCDNYIWPQQLPAYFPSHFF